VVDDTKLGHPGRTLPSGGARYGPWPR
jgi:hypothetical protein